MMKEPKIRTRFAPSPTGYLHIGGARTALFNWLYARHMGGAFVLRIEDTDQQRSTDESTRAILDAMTWLGLDWDEGPFYQAQRVENHRAMVKKLLQEGKAYYCTCSPDELEEKRKIALAEGRKPKYDGTCRDKNLPKSANSVVRFRCPEIGSTVVNDLIKGNIVFNNEELDDLIIERQDGYPTYNFAVVIDDAEMNITHVIRGDDHVNNTPKQILLYEALGYAVPRFAHVPMILGSDKARLSKRHGATSVMAYKDMGYLPEALVNYLVRLSWSHGDQEIFGVDELIELFSLDAVGKSAAVFNPDKLLWLNQHYIKNCPLERLAEEMLPFWHRMGLATPEETFARNIVGDLRERAKTLIELAEGSLFYFGDELIYEEEAARKFLTAEAGGHLEAIMSGLPDLTDYTKAGIETFLRDLSEKRNTKLKFIAQPLRVALTGKTVSPGIDDVMVTLGKEKVLQRLQQAVQFIGGQSVQSAK
ncbi:MAG TPA: glutamate--tRNA ligase [Syntrophales bacterium]|jgi:glutamyl-tRNA synthetase|nr:glutamate--tRNA ligase [Syntrophales bacterium]HQA83517.1 glutamate--tRNA ligase [Syntrophales bacterium]